MNISNRIDSLDSNYSLVNQCISDSTKIKLTVMNESGDIIPGATICYTIKERTSGTITSNEGKATLVIDNEYTPDYIKVNELFHSPAYIPVSLNKISSYEVYLKNQSIDQFTRGIIKLKVETNWVNSSRKKWIVYLNNYEKSFSNSAYIISSKSFCSAKPFW